MSNTSQSTRRVVKQHLNAFILDLGIETLLSDYNERAVLISPDGVYRGKQEIGHFLDNLKTRLPDKARDSFKLHIHETSDDVSYIVWSVKDRVPLGTDTFVVRNNKIVHQTFAMYAQT